MNEPAKDDIRHEPGGAQGRFVLDRDGARLAEMVYSPSPDGRRAVIEHTSVSDVLKGQGVGRRLVAAAVEWARREHVTLECACPFAKAVFEKTPEFRDVLPQE